MSKSKNTNKRVELCVSVAAAKAAAFDAIAAKHKVSREGLLLILVTGVIAKELASAKSSPTATDNLKISDEIGGGTYGNTDRNTDR
jgi:hypothetical protein